MNMHIDTTVPLIAQVRINYTLYVRTCMIEHHNCYNLYVYMCRLYNHMYVSHSTVVLWGWPS